ncbi:class I adenylate-forming enzyme family protein [Mycobacterium sp. AMU20-3851]|uniref:class I adenylate-forming enzyme family protein n=1 Tax=Mycobacterium sp. AMU20-3851 TaxID=3122055 RepID=UPI003754A850
MNLASVFHHQAVKHPTKLAIRDAQVQLSYASLDDQSARVAAFLAGESIKPGDRVAIYMANSAQYIVVALGIWKAGGVLVPLNTAIPPAPLRHAVADSGARIVFADPQTAPRLVRDFEGFEIADRLVVCGPVGEDVRPQWTYEQVLTAPPAPTIEPRLDGDDAMIMYTSGSSGTPKGVRQTHRNITAYISAITQIWDFSVDDFAVICTPFFHVGGMQLMILPMLLNGASAYTLARWNAAQWRQAVQDCNATYTALVPTMVVDVANAFEDDPADLSSVRLCAIGGSVLPEGPVRRFLGATGIRNAVNIYGQTEQSGVAICERPGEQDHPRVLGRPLEQLLSWKLVDVGTGADVSDHPGQVGELRVRGDAVTPGYWNLPDVNAEKFVDGWLRTGDLMRTDTDGVLHFVERSDEMIISGGENVYPQMIENSLASCPDVAEVAVIGTHHERWIQQVTAIVVPRSAAVTRDDIIAYCADHPDLQGLQRPRRIELVAALPRTGNNKIDRTQLKRDFV